MLASISPLGERARGNRWRLTAAAYAVGSTAAATALGAALGTVGGLVGLSGSASWRVLAIVAALAGIADLVAHRRIPTVHRQVNEDWLTRYRGWVYGLGFGVQLGVGVATIVTTATVYAWLAGATLTGSPAGGALAGAAFGLARSVPLLLVAPVDSAAALRRLLRRVNAYGTVARIGAASVSLGVGVLAGMRA